MRKRVIGIMAFVIVISIVFGAGTVYGASSKPGSSGDPLITLSYLNERLSENEAVKPYKKVVLEKGKSIMLSEGSTIILYSGNVSVIGNNGMIDLTDGELIARGKSAEKYQMLLSPSGTSGLASIIKSELYVQGSYTIK